MNVRLDEWEALALLMEKGIALEDALPLAFRESDSYLQRLAAGENCFACEGRKASMMERCLSFFMQAAGLSQAILMALHLCTIRKTLGKQLAKQASYPIVLFVMSFVLVLFFLSVIFPQMQQLTDGQDAGMALGVLRLLRLGFTLLMILLALFAILAFFLWKQTDARCWCIVRFHARLPLLQEVISYLFAAYLHELMEAGIDTRHALALLERLEEKSVLFPCVMEMQTLLAQGFSYDEILLTSTYFSKRFRRFFLIGYRSSTLSQTLKLFCEQALTRWQSQLKRGGMILQIIVYAVIGLLVFCVYQLLLMPLDMLNQM